jgi:hypothetical protein
MGVQLDEGESWNSGSGALKRAAYSRRAQAAEGRSKTGKGNQASQNDGAGGQEEGRLKSSGDTYDLFETRPGTTDKQRDTGRAALDALESAERRIFGAASGLRGYQAAVLGSAISADFRDNGGTSFVGKRVTTSGDLAMLGQAVRDPRFETFRVFYTDTAGKVADQAAYQYRPIDWSKATTC